MKNYGNFINESKKETSTIKKQEERIVLSLKNLRKTKKKLKAKLKEDNKAIDMKINKLNIDKDALKRRRRELLLKKK